MEELKREYEQLLKRLQKAEQFFLDLSIDDDKKIKFVDEFNKIQKEIAIMQREYKNKHGIELEE